jgi:hypothetical protein
MTPYSTAVVKDYAGIGISVDEFERRLVDRRIKLAAVSSRLPMVDMIADAIGWNLDEVTRDAKPIISSGVKKTPHGLDIQPGMVCGVEVIQSGKVGKDSVVTVEWKFVVEPEKEDMEVVDQIIIEGEPNLDIVVRGLSSVVSTYAHVVNCIPEVLSAKPGLTSVRDLPVASAHV